MINSSPTVNFCILVKTQYCVCLSLILISLSHFHGVENPQADKWVHCSPEQFWFRSTPRAKCWKLTLSKLEAKHSSVRRIKSQIKWSWWLQFVCNVLTQCCVSFFLHVHTLYLAEGVQIRQDRALRVGKPGQLCKATVTSVCGWSSVLCKPGLCKPPVSHLHIPKATENQRQGYCTVLNQEA